MPASSIAVRSTGSRCSATTSCRSSACCSRALFLEQGGFDVELDTLEDWNLWLRYLGATGGFAYVDKTTSRYRVPLDRTLFAARRAKLDADYAVAVKKAQGIAFRATVGDLAPEVDELRRVEAGRAPRAAARLDATYERWLVAHHTYHGFRQAVRDLLFPAAVPRDPGSGSNGV